MEERRTQGQAALAAAAAGPAAQDVSKGAPQGVQNAQNAPNGAQGAPSGTQAQNKPARRRGKAYFTASRIAKIALLTALAYAVTFLEFPIFPGAPFLQLDFSNVFVLLGGFMYGPLASVLISGIKEVLSLLDSGTVGVGEIANFIMTLAFVLVPVTVYRFKKGLGVVILTLAIGTLLAAAVALPVNRFINFPLFAPDSYEQLFEATWWYVLLFNLIKGVAVSLVTVLLYKRISWLFNKF